MASQLLGEPRTEHAVSLQLQPGERTVVPEPVRAFLMVAMRRWKTIDGAEATMRQEQLEDLQFRASEQWPDTTKNNRSQDNRPCLTVNRLPEFIRQVTNAQRQNRPAAKVSPVDSGADLATARVFQSLVRRVEAASNADVAYTNGGESQVTIGNGYWRLLTEFVPGTMLQEIRIKQLPDPFSVYLDPACAEPDCSDARYAFIVEDMPKEEFKLRWPDMPMESLSEFSAMGGSQGRDWAPEGKVRIAEYFYVEEEHYTLSEFLLADGSTRTLPRDDWEAMNLNGTVDGSGQPTVTWELLQEREDTRKTVKWALISAGHILDGNEDRTAGRVWPGKAIPIVRVVGDEIDINGVKDRRGMVRDARDPQRMVNYWESALTEAIALAPRAPWVVAKGQLENFETQWDTANTRNWPYLQYNPVTADGKALPPPQRQAFEPAIQAIQQAAAHADQNLKNVTGFHASSLGELSPSETSGKAIQALQKQAELGASNYLDNLGRAIRYTGELLVDLIPKIYVPAQVMRILGEDDQVQGVVVYAGEENRPEDVDPQNLPPGISGMYDLGAGTYDVTVTVGRSFETRRQEAVQTLTELIKSFPEAQALSLDILSENMDVPWGQKLAARFKSLLPPQAQEDELENLPPEAQAMVQALQAQLAEAQQALEAQGRQIETDEHKERVRLEGKTAEIASRERIAAGRDATTAKTNRDDNETALEIAELNNSIKLLVARLDAQEERAGRELERERLDHDAGKTAVVEAGKREAARRRPERGART